MSDNPTEQTAHLGIQDGQLVGVVNEPVVIHEGKYRLYGKPDGGLHVVYQRTDRNEADHFEVPGPLLALAQSAAEGKLSPADILRQMTKMRNGG